VLYALSIMFFSCV